MFSENDKARIHQNIEVRLSQIELKENSDSSILLPKEKDVPNKSSGSTPSQSGRMQKMILNI